jgi:hypothetical protein
MSSQSVDIIQKPFDRKYSKEWHGHFYKSEIFLQMYIMEKYKDILFHVPFNELEVVYDEKNKILYGNLCSYSKDKCEHIHYRETYLQEDFGKNFKKYITKHRKTKKRFSYHVVSLTDYNSDIGHAMTVLYDSKTKEIEFFQRNPGTEKYSVFENSKPILINFFRYVYGENIKPVFNNNLCVKAAFFSELCYNKNWELNKRIYGDCMIWSLWYLELRLKNHALSRRQALNKTIKIFTKNLKWYTVDTHLVCKVILGYSTFIDNITEQFYWVKTSNGRAIRIDKKKTTPLLKKAERLLKMYLFYIRNCLKM